MFVLLFKSHAYEVSRELLTHTLGVALSSDKTSMSHLKLIIKAPEQDSKSMASGF